MFYFSCWLIIFKTQYLLSLLPHMFFLVILLPDFWCFHFWSFSFCLKKYQIIGCMLVSIPVNFLYLRLSLSGYYFHSIWTFTVHFYCIGTHKHRITPLSFGFSDFWASFWCCLCCLPCSGGYIIYNISFWMLFSPSTCNFPFYLSL